MDINRLTEKTQEALSAAQSEALRRGNQQIDVEHLLAALLSQEGGLAASILKRAGANVEALASRLNPATNGEVFVWALNPRIAYLDKRLVHGAGQGC